MGDVRVDLDRLSEAAWKTFRTALADAIDGLAVGERLVIEHYCCEGGDACPPHAFVTRQQAFVLVEVASNKILNREQQLSRRDCAQLRRLGFKSATRAEPYYWLAVPGTHVDQAASLVVDAMRGPFTVVHPSFLACPDVPWTADSDLPTTDVIPESPTAVYPVDREHLDRLVDQALSPVVGCLPERDSDGDLPIRAGSTVTFVHTYDDRPVVHLFSLMAVDATDLAAAKTEVHQLNSQIDGIKFTLSHDIVVASVDLPAMPFVAEHLQAVVDRLIAVVTANDALLASRIGGRVFASRAEVSADCPETDGTGDADDIHPAMRCLLQIDAVKPGSLKPKVAARVCGYDRDLLLELIQWNEQQESEWREARDLATDSKEFEVADACEHERAHAEHTTKVLRKALRRVVLG